MATIAFRAGSVKVLRNPRLFRTFSFISYRNMQFLQNCKRATPFLESVRNMGILDKIRDKTSSRAEKKALDAFRKQVSEMLEVDHYTIIHFRKQVDEGMDSWSSKIPFLRNRPEIAQMKHSKSILDAFTVEEQNDPTLINESTIKRVAVTAERSIDDVKQLVLSYEQAETIHRWLRARKAKGQRIPKNSSDLQDLLIDPRGITIAKFLKNKPMLTPKGIQSKRIQRQPLIF